MGMLWIASMALTPCGCGVMEGDGFGLIATVNEARMVMCLYRVLKAVLGISSSLTLSWELPRRRVLGRDKTRSANFCRWSDYVPAFLMELICRCWATGAALEVKLIWEFYWRAGGRQVVSSEIGGILSIEATDGWPFVVAVPGLMTHLVASLTLDTLQRSGDTGHIFYTREDCKEFAPLDNSKATIMETW
ncbi:hypothetical protein Tco_0172459 [Tanacetum coccineum]